jgi:hypothetical protein
MRARRQPAQDNQRVQPAAEYQPERGGRVYLLPRSTGLADHTGSADDTGPIDDTGPVGDGTALSDGTAPADHNRSRETCPVPAKYLVVVRVVGGPRDGERFATRLAGLIEGMVFRYFGHDYAFGRDPRTGRWAAILSRPDALRPPG